MSNKNEVNKDNLAQDNEDTKRETTEEETELKKIIKEGSGLSILKIAATALTAVSMALLSANLTGIVNSLMLVAIVSIGTAIVSEFYRVILSVTSLGAKKVVAPVLQTTVIKDKDGKTTTVTSETPILDETDLKNLKEDAREQENMKSLEEQVVETGNGKIRLIFSKIKYKISHYFRNNPFMRFILLFAGIAILTISTSYFVSEGNNNTDSIFTTVYKTEEQKQSLSETEKQEIIDEAVAQAKESSPATTIVEKETEVKVDNTPNQTDDQTPSNDQTDSNNSQPTETNDNSETSSTNTDNGQNNNNTNTSNSEQVSQDDIQKLLDRIEQLEKDNTTLKTELDTLRNEPVDNSSNNSVTEEELQEQINTLQEQIDELNNNTPTTNNSAASSNPITPNSTTNN